MPAKTREKKARSSHGLKALRAACGFTQPVLAKVLGVSWRTIVAIEVGQRSLSRDIAERIMLATGALPDSLLSKSASPLDLNGQPYSRDFFEHWKSKILGFVNDQDGRFTGSKPVQQPLVQLHEAVAL